MLTLTVTQLRPQHVFDHISPFSLWFINYAWGLLRRQRHQSRCGGGELFSHVRRTIYCISHKLSRNRQINKCWFEVFFSLFCLHSTLFLISQPDRPSLHLLWFITLERALHFIHKLIYFTHADCQVISWLYACNSCGEESVNLTYGGCVIYFLY